MPERNGGALDGLTVVNLGSDLDSAYAAKLLSDLGARTIWVEPPAGAPLRRRPPQRRARRRPTWAWCSIFVPED